MACDLRPALAVLVMLPLAASPQHHEPARDSQVLAPGYSALEFEAPEPGSYNLPSLGAAADGRLLDSNGQAVTLHELYEGKTVVLSFIYTSCQDVNGCPLATFVLSQVQKHLARDASLRGDVRLVTISFDPRNDTPDVMADYSRHFRKAAVDWRFLTAESEQAVAPVLQRYDQFVVHDTDGAGEPLGTISHVLRVYLIDTDGNIRNIYSPSYLHADTLYADIRTVAGG